MINPINDNHRTMRTKRDGGWTYGPTASRLYSTHTYDSFGYNLYGRRNSWHRDSAFNDIGFRIVRNR
jgi:hypothetical protein